MVRKSKFEHYFRNVWRRPIRRWDWRWI